MSRPGDGAPCPVCSAPARHLLDARDRNRATTDATFDYSRCGVCATVFLRDVPGDLARYYADDYYQFDADGQPAWRRMPPVIESARYRVELLLRHGPAGHLIEIGAGTGAFALAARDAGFTVSAIEMSERCCEYLSDAGVEAIVSSDPVAALQRLEPADAIAMWHVLEHLPDPLSVLRAAAAKLRAGGLLAVAVPNPSSLQFRLLRSRWMHLDAPRHLRLIAPSTLIDVAAKLGLRCLATTTRDPDGVQCDLIGWINALRARPSEPEGSWLVGQLGGLLWRAAAPLERTGDRGSAISLVFRAG